MVSYNISRQQVGYARDLCRGLPVRFEMKDYREAKKEAGLFERIVSVGFCEHVGYRNYRTFFELAEEKLALFEQLQSAGLGVEAAVALISGSVVALRPAAGTARKPAPPGPLRAPPPTESEADEIEQVLDELDDGEELPPGKKGP